MYQQLRSSAPKETNPSKRIVRHIDVSMKLGVGPSTLFSMISDGRFPKPFVIVPGGRAVGWLESDVDAWIANRRSEAREGGQ
jgi:prophage regulatory protein